MDASLGAAFWGLISGSALVLGALIGYFARLSNRVTAGVMAFGSGILISALSIDLTQDAYKAAGFWPMAMGFLSGAMIFTVLNWVISKYGGHHRKRSNGQQKSEGEQEGSGLAIALGALLDGVPESVVIGLSLLAGKGVSVVAVAAFFLSNIPEGLSSTTGMVKAKRGPRYIFTIWISIMLISSLSAWAGYVLFGGLSSEYIAAITAFAAGAILSMLVSTMIPEAFSEVGPFSGLITVVGFLLAVFLSKFNG